MASPSGILSGFFNSPRKQRRFFIVSATRAAHRRRAFLATRGVQGHAERLHRHALEQAGELYHPEQDGQALARRAARPASSSGLRRRARDLDAAYTIVHPDLKGTLTRKQWDTGNIPVVTYPARNADTAAFVVDYSFKTSALLEIDLVARPGQDQCPELRFYIGLKREGGKPNGRWPSTAGSRMSWRPSRKPRKRTPLELIREFLGGRAVRNL